MIRDYWVFKMYFVGTPKTIMQFVASQMAPHKKIRVVEMIDEIPKSLSGKILQRVLIDREREMAKG